MRKIAQFGDVKVYRNVEWNEYIVKQFPDEVTWYYTSDKQDALDTAQSFANRSDYEHFDWKAERQNYLEDMEQEKEDRRVAMQRLLLEENPHFDYHHESLEG